MGRVAIKCFADGAKASILEMMLHGHQKGAGQGRLAINPVVGGNKGTQQPGPNGALMSGAVALERVTLTALGVGQVFRGQAAQTIGGNKLQGANINHGFGLIST